MLRTLLLTQLLRSKVSPSMTGLSPVFKCVKVYLKKIIKLTICFRTEALSGRGPVLENSLKTFSTLVSS